MRISPPVARARERPGMPASDMVADTAASMASTLAGGKAPGGPMTWARSGGARRAMARTANRQPALTPLPPGSAPRLLQPVPVLQLLWQVLPPDEAHTTTGEGLQLAL